MKLTIFLIILSLNSFSQSITIEVDVFRHMRAKIDSCDTLSTSEKDDLIKQQDEELQKRQLVIDRLDRYLYDVTGEKEDVESNLIQLSCHYKKEIKKRKRTGLIAAIAATGATIVAVIIKHNYDLQKNRE